MHKDELVGYLWVVGFFLFGLCLGALSSASLLSLVFVVGLGVYKLIFSSKPYSRDDAGYWLAVFVFGAIATLGSAVGTLLAWTVGRFL